MTDEFEVTIEGDESLFKDVKTEFARQGGGNDAPTWAELEAVLEVVQEQITGDIRNLLSFTMSGLLGEAVPEDAVQ